MLYHLFTGTKGDSKFGLLWLYTLKMPRLLFGTFLVAWCTSLLVFSCVESLILLPRSHTIFLDFQVLVNNSIHRTMADSKFIRNFIHHHLSGGLDQYFNFLAFLVADTVCGLPGCHSSTTLVLSFTNNSSHSYTFLWVGLLLPYWGGSLRWISATCTRSNHIKSDRSKLFCFVALRHWRCHVGNSLSSLTHWGRGF
jgi:hypothetical protein